MEFTWNQMFGSDTRYDAEHIAPDKVRLTGTLRYVW